MASLRKRLGSPYYVACWITGDGKPTQRSTKQKDRAKAMLVTLEWERAAQSARERVLTEAQALKVIANILARTGDVLHGQTIREYLADWLEGKNLTRAKGTALRYLHTITSLLDFLGDKADRPLSNLTSRDIDQFRNDQAAQGKSAATVNLAIKTVRIPLNLARRQGLILINPAEATELLPTASNTRDVFSLEQLQALVAVSNTEWRGMILIAAFAGLRLGDVTKLTIGNFDFERRTLKYLPQKSARSRRSKALEVPLHPEIETYLLDLAIDTDKVSAPIFPTLGAKKISGAGGLSLTFRKLMGKAGVQATILTEQTSGKGRRFYNLSFHSLRHTFVSALANQGVHPEVRMKLSGHTSDVHQRYTHHELETLRKSVEALPKLSS